MPGFDGTGPLAAGPMTGWGRGYCIGYLQQDYETTHGAGMSRRRGRRNCFYATGLYRWSRCFPGRALSEAVYTHALTKEDSLDDLRAKIAHLEKTLEQAKKQIEELGKQA